MKIKNLFLIAVMFFAVAACQNSVAPTPVSTPKTLKDFVDAGYTVLENTDNRKITFDVGKSEVVFSSNNESFRFSYEFTQDGEGFDIKENNNRLVTVQSTVTLATPAAPTNIVELFPINPANYQGEGRNFMILGYTLVKP